MSDTELIEKTSGSESREKTKQWLEDVLQSYYTYLLKKDKSPEEKANIPRVPVSVLDFDIGPGFSAGDGRVSTLSDLLSLHVTFMVSQRLSSTDKVEAYRFCLVSRSCWIISNWLCFVFFI